ncbi:hypothetical protein D3C76_1783740 [compost metagenome]
MLFGKVAQVLDFIEFEAFTMGVQQSVIDAAPHDRVGFTVLVDQGKRLRFQEVGIIDHH